MTAKDSIVAGQTNSPVSTVFERYSNGRPATSSPTAVMPLVGSGLEFVLPGGSLQKDQEIDDHFPKLEKISRRHSKVARRFRPGDPNFAWKELSSAFQLKTGKLTVEGYFGDPDAPKSLNFGYVASSRPNVPFYSLLPYTKVANKLLWEVELPKGQRTVTINHHVWDPGQASTSALVLQPSTGQNEIEVTIAHTEVEVPLLFLEDPYIPYGVGGLPDPDFEMFPGLSSNYNSRSRCRVPVPEPGQPTGGTEKPCIGGMFAGFA